jgi:cellulose synthase/poly-beta-1,6-N-acetylglucosamine synthase-like glycosyltransferase
MSSASIIALLGLLAALPAVWPFGPYQLSLLLARALHRFPKAPVPAGPEERLTFAICLCVYNEAAVIREKAADLLRLREASGGDLEIAIYVDAASDGTAEILEAYRDRIKLIVSPQRRGKTHGMNLLVAETAGSIIMFTDANVRIASDAVAVLRRYFADPGIGCVCSNLSYVNADASATAAVGSAFWSFNEWTKGLETATGSVIGADGSLFAIRRRVHRPVPKGLFDDLYVSLSVLLAGSRVVRAPDLKAYETHSTSAADEFRRKARIACECMAVHFELWPELRRLDGWNLYKYLGHRLTRWIGGYALLLSALCLGLAGCLAFGVFVTALAILLGGAAFALALKLGLKPATMMANILLAFAGNALGAWRASRGVRAVTWEPPASARAGQLHQTGSSR